MRYYRRKRYTDQRTKKVVLRILFVIITAAVIAVLASFLGNHVKKMVEEAENRIAGTETGLDQTEAEPPLQHFNTAVPGEKISVSAVGIAMGEEGLVPEPAVLKGQFDTVSVNITENGRLIYVSPALVALTRLPSDGSEGESDFTGYEKIKELAGEVKSENLRLCAILEASQAGGVLLTENDKALVSEFVGLGFDEVILTGFDEISGDVVSYLSRLAGNRISVGVVFPAEEYLDSDNEKLIRMISASGVFLCADLNIDHYPLDEADRRTQTLCSKLRNSITSQNLRIFIDSDDESYIGAEYASLLKIKIDNIQFTSPRSYEALMASTSDPSDETGAAEGNAETGENENPYAVTGGTETGAAEETAETESTDVGARDPGWY